MAETYRRLARVQACMAVEGRLVLELLCLALAARALQGGSGALAYATYLGGDGAGIIHAMAVDGSNNVHLTGETLSSNFPVTAGAVQTRLAGNSDVFVAKLSPDGSFRRQWIHAK